MSEDFTLGITESFACNYLPNQLERLLVATDPRLQNSRHYSWLIAQGFRRSGEQIYRPHCVNCSACQSIRVLVNDFACSKSQKRNVKRNNQFHVKTSLQQKDLYYPLYEKYINTVHADGTMYPANYEQFESFIKSDVTQQMFLEVWDDDKLISVAVMDVLNNALSAVYTFYHPEYRNNAIGIFSILMQLKLAKEHNKMYLYLGYQIDDCQKMNYKNKYHPFQRLVLNKWHTVNK
ncbi:MAG: arginyl-tRNA--protein-N-Asp/Glu arginylyltransferase [Alteromonadaceae bacterium]|jgi:arginyl-tRNA--protein-N-Asp/Glu arginylyltransferase